MLFQRDLGSVQLFQIVEFCGPTHDADAMLPDVPRRDLKDNAGWLYPDFWLPESNRLVFSMQMFVLKTPSDIVIIDTGVGNFKTRPAPTQDRLNTPALDWLVGIGCCPNRVKHVVHTHLHGDHVGWNTCWTDGQWQPTFPNATYYIPVEDWAVYHPRYSGGVQDHISGPFVDSVLPVVQAGLVRFIKAGDEVAGLLQAFAAPGHSPGQLGYWLDAGGENCLFAGDVFHCPIQIQFPHVNSRWCEYPDVARATRMALLRRAAETRSLIFPAHTRGLAGWRIVAREGEFSLGEV